MSADDFNNRTPRRGGIADQHRREEEANAKREAERKRLGLPPEADFYHIHIYFDPGTPSEGIAKRLTFSRLYYVTESHRTGAVGPHPKPNYALTIDGRHHDIAEIMQWLRDNHEGISILIHTRTGDEIKDHTTGAVWIGPPLQLNMAFLAQFKPKPPKGP